MSSEWRSAKRLLLIRLDNLGDVLLMTPAFHAVRQNLPDATITLLASPIGAQVGELSDDIDDVIVFKAPWMDVDRTLPQDSERELAMVRQLQDRRFDGAIIFTSYHQSALPGAYLSYLAEIPLRHAASIDFPGTLLTSRHRHPAGIMHEVERALDLVAGVGFTTEDKDMRLAIPQSVVEEMRARLLAQGASLERPMVAIHPGCSAQARTYDWQKYARVADLLIENIGADVVFTGVTAEAPLVEQIMATMQRPAMSLAGRTSFQEMAAVIRLADLVITNNTGPMHICSCLKTPVVVLFAHTNYAEQWGPWRVPHRILNHPVECVTPCYKFTCPVDRACLDKVAPETVAEAGWDVLQEARQGVGQEWL